MDARSRQARSLGTAYRRVPDAGRQPLGERRRRRQDLAYFLQALAAVLLMCEAAHAAPFSHKTHLQLKLQCLSCHTSAPTSTKVEDNNLPQAAVCLSCHKDARAIKAPRPSKLAKFSHQQHLKLGNMAPVIAAAIDSKTYLSQPGDIRRFLNTKNACEA